MTASAVGQPSAQLPTLTHIEQLRKLSTEGANRHFPVRLKAVVTYFDAFSESMFIQDATGGTWASHGRDSARIEAGQLIELEGITMPGFAPSIDQPRWKVLGTAPLPAPRRVSFEQLASATEDGQWQEIEGMVRSARVETDRRLFRLSLAVTGGHLTVSVPDQDTVPAGLVDGGIRVHGVCGERFKRRQQLIGVNICVPNRRELRIIEPAPADPVDAPAQPIALLNRFTFFRGSNRRVRIAGIVTAQMQGKVIYVMKERRTGAHIPVIAMTAHAFNEDRERGLAADMDGYVSKPIRIEKLLQAIDSVFGTAVEAGSPAVEHV